MSKKGKRVKGKKSEPVVVLVLVASLQASKKPADEE